MNYQKTSKLPIVLKATRRLSENRFFEFYGTRYCVCSDCIVSILASIFLILYSWIASEYGYYYALTESIPAHDQRSLKRRA